MALWREASSNNKMIQSVQRGSTRINSSQLTILESRSRARGLVLGGKYTDRGRTPSVPLLAPACLACLKTTALAALSWMKHMSSSDGNPRTSTIICGASRKNEGRGGGGVEVFDDGALKVKKKKCWLVLLGVCVGGGGDKG